MTGTAVSGAWLQAARPKGRVPGDAYDSRVAAKAVHQQYRLALVAAALVADAVAPPAPVPAGRPPTCSQPARQGNHQRARHARRLEAAAWPGRCMRAGTLVPGHMRRASQQARVCAPCGHGLSCTHATCCTKRMALSNARQGSAPGPVGISAHAERGACSLDAWLFDAIACVWASMCVATHACVWAPGVQHQVHAALSVSHAHAPLVHSRLDLRFLWALLRKRPADSSPPGHCWAPRWLRPMLMPRAA